MGNWSLDDVDEVLRDPSWWVSIGFVQRDDRSSEAWQHDVPLATLGLLIRLGRTKLRLKKYGRYWPHGVLHCAVAPPRFVIDVAHACGATVLVGPWEPERVPRLILRHPSLPRMHALAGEACARIADGLGIGVDLDGLARLERDTPRTERAAGEEAYWSACLRTAAFTGEVLRRRIGGRWTMAPLISSTGLAFRCGVASDANVVDKAMKFLESGPAEEGLVQFARMVESIQSEMG